LSILIEKRINPSGGSNFKIWSLNYLIFSLFIPLVILLPIRLLRSSRYTKFILQKEKTINKVIVITTGIILIWLLLWYTMFGLRDLMHNIMEKSVKVSEAEAAVLTSIKDDNIIKTKIGLIDSIEYVSKAISSKKATFDYILYGNNSTLNVEILLCHDQKWIVDTILIK